MRAAYVFARKGRSVGGTEVNFSIGTSAAKFRFFPCKTRVSNEAQSGGYIQQTDRQT